MSTLRLQSEPMVLRMAKAIASYIGFGDEIDIPIPHATTTSLRAHTATPKPRIEQPKQRETSLRLMPAPPASESRSDHKWRRHPQLRAYEAPISREVRDGRHDAVRGLYAAREGALDVATRHFAMAARCEDIDLTALPGFWNLTRGQMQTALNAYESVGRYRDAAALDAHIETIFRPSLVGSSRQPIVPARPRPRAANT